MLHVSLFAAFIAGMLSLLPACGPALLPAFFAYTFARPVQLVRATLVFALGFAAVFIPFGLGVSWFVQLITIEHVWLTRAVGVLLLLFAGLAVMGRPFAVQVKKAAGKQRRGVTHAAVLGITFGLTAGSCTAPVLGAVLTLAAVSGNTISVLLLLATFVLGLFTPLLVLALLFRRFGQTMYTRYLTAGVELTMGGHVVRLYWGNILAGLLFALLGMFYILNEPLVWAHLFNDWLPLQDWFYQVNQRLLS